MKRLAFFACLAVSFTSPAWSDSCKLTRIADGILTQTELSYGDGMLYRMFMETSPYLGNLRMADGASHTPVDNPWVGFHGYRKAGTAEGKDWREPGGVTSKRVGFALQWPNLKSSLARIEPDLFIVIKLGPLVSAASTHMHEGFLPTSGISVPLDKGMDGEWPHDWRRRFIEETEWQAWQDALDAGGTMRVEFYHPDRREDLIASAEIELPPYDVALARFQSDVADARARARAGTCK